MRFRVHAIWLLWVGLCLQMLALPSSLAYLLCTLIGSLALMIALWRLVVRDTEYAHALRWTLGTLALHIVCHVFVLLGLSGIALIVRGAAAMAQLFQMQGICTAIADELHRIQSPLESRISTCYGLCIVQTLLSVAVTLFANLPLLSPIFTASGIVFEVLILYGLFPACSELSSQEDRQSIWR